MGAYTLRTWQRRAGVALPLLWLLALALPVAADPTLDDQLAVLDHQLALAEDPSAYLRRADVYRQRHAWDAALSDCARALRAGGDAETVELLRAQVLLDADHAAEARAALERLLAAAPDSPAPRLLHATVALRLSDPGAAADDYARAVPALRAPLPDHYIAWSQALSAAGREAEALQRLDQGLTRLGPLPVLQLAAVETAVRLGDAAGAVHRLDVMLASQPRQPALLARRAELLQQTGRQREAQAAYRQALEVLTSRTAAGRQSTAMTALERRVRMALAAQTATTEETR